MAAITATCAAPQRRRSRSMRCSPDIWSRPGCCTYCGRPRPTRAPALPPAQTAHEVLRRSPDKATAFVRSACSVIANEEFSMSNPAWLGAALAGSLAAISVAASAHEIVGNRFFPATLAIDDPGVNDELAFPTIARFKTPTTPDSPAFRQLDVSAEFSKRITEDFAISISPTWSKLYSPGGPTMVGASGFQNLETAFKYRVYKNDEHEFVFSAGLEYRMGRQRRAKRRCRALQHLHAHDLFRQRYGRPAGGFDAALRGHRRARLRPSRKHGDEIRHRHRPGHRRAVGRHRISPAHTGLGRLASVQHAVSEIRRGRPRPARRRQSPDPDRGGLAANAGVEYLHLGRVPRPAQSIPA